MAQHTGNGLHPLLSMQTTPASWNRPCQRTRKSGDCIQCLNSTLPVWVPAGGWVDTSVCSIQCNTKTLLPFIDAFTLLITQLCRTAYNSFGKEMHRPAFKFQILLMFLVHPSHLFQYKLLKGTAEAYSQLHLELISKHLINMLISPTDFCLQNRRENSADVNANQTRPSSWLYAFGCASCSCWNCPCHPSITKLV